MKTLTFDPPEPQVFLADLALAEKLLAPGMSAPTADQIKAAIRTNGVQPVIINGLVTIYFLPKSYLPETMQGGVYEITHHKAWRAILEPPKEAT